MVVRGRGKATEGSKMDKYFSKSYNPELDIEPDLNQLVYTEFDDEPKKKKKKSKKKSKKKRDETTDIPSSNRFWRRR